MTKRREIIDGKTICSKCKESKPISEFHTHIGKWSGLHSHCKPCYSARCKLYKANRTPEMVKLQQQKMRNWNLKRKYGIDWDKFTDMQNYQEHKCKICAVKFCEEAHKKNSIHVDHCHKTNKLRALLCFSCNTMLGAAKDRRDILMNAIQYLQEYA